MIVRIAGTILPGEKRIEASLPYLYGIGPSKASQILNQAGIDFNIRTKNLTEDQVNKIRLIIEKEEKVEGDLRREIISNIKRLKEIGSYRGSRHAKGLPVRGQRTKTNSRTVRGNTRKTAGSGKKATGQKT